MLEDLFVELTAPCGCEEDCDALAQYRSICRSVPSGIVRGYIECPRRGAGVLITVHDSTRITITIPP